MTKLKFKTEDGTFEEAENVKNKVLIITEYSTHKQYPSARAVWDYVGNIEAVLDEIRGVNNDTSL